MNEKRSKLTCTSSSLRIGMLRTLYLDFNSFDNGAVINFRRICDGALKCLLRFLLRSDVTNLLNFILIAVVSCNEKYFQSSPLGVVFHAIYCWENEVSFCYSEIFPVILEISRKNLCSTAIVPLMHTLIINWEFQSRE